MPRNSGGTEHAQTVCNRLFFLCPRARAWEQDYRVVNPLFSHDVKQSGTPGQISWASAHFRD